MGARGAIRRSSIALGLVLALSSACAGRSERTGDGADEADGGTAGTNGGSGGSSQGGDFGSGGAEPAGGTSDGGTGALPSGGVGATGGVIATGGTGTGGGIIVTGGTGGAPVACPTCPEADYGLVIEGDGATYDIDYNGTIDSAADKAPATCPEQPLAGVISACTRSLMFSACEDPMSGPPCLEVAGQTARYVDHQSGKLWNGFVISDVPAAAGVAGVASGTLTLSFTDASGEMLLLTVRYTVCAPLGNLRIPC